MSETLSFSEHPAFRRLDELGLKPGEYAIFGSGPMFAHGIRPIEDLHDLDIIVDAAAWRTLAQKYKSRYDPEWDCDGIQFDDDLIEISNGVLGFGKDAASLIAESEIIAGYPFVQLSEVVKWKREMGRDKDLKHIAMIETYLKAN